MKKIIMRSLLLALAIGAYTAQTLSMQQQQRPFEVMNQQFVIAPTSQRKLEILHSMFVNAGSRVVPLIRRPENEPDKRQIVFNDLQTLELLAAGYPNDPRIQNDMAHFAAGNTFAQVVALFQPEDLGQGALAPEDHVQPGHVADVAERFDVVGEHPALDGAPVLGARPPLQPQPQSWRAIPSRWWWLIAPIAVIVIALVYRNKKSSAPMPQPSRRA